MTEGTVIAMSVEATVSTEAGLAEVAAAAATVAPLASNRQSA